MIKEVIGTLVSGRSLTSGEAAAAMEEIMENRATPAQLGGFLVALRMKGETAEEIAALVSVMQSRAVRVNLSMPVLDIAGTGGDHAETFNISTAAAFVAAGAGVNIAKHGNRAASSRCGSADVLEALGIKIELTAEQVIRCVEEVGIGFMFAPSFHPAMRFAAAPRRELAIRTVFNLLGPLANPACAPCRVIGVSEPEMGEKMAAVLSRLEIEHALIVHGLGGWDEISITGESLVWELNGCEISASYKIRPEDFGMPSAPFKTIAGGSPEENARILRSVLAGEKSPRRDVVVLNAAAGLLAAGRVETLRQGAALAGEAIDSGEGLKKLDQLISLTRNFR